MRAKTLIWYGAATAALLATCLGAVAAEAEVVQQDVEAVDGLQDLDNSLDNDKAHFDIKSLQELCAAKQLVSCLKLTLYRGLERLSRRPQLELLPGLTVTGDVTSLQDLSRDVTSGQDEEVLTGSLARYLSSLSLTVRVLDGGVMRRIREMGEAFTQVPDDTSVTGRRKRFGSSMMMAGMMSGGSMMALAMSAIAMMAGKALMMSLLSLMMTGMMSMGKGGGGGEKTTYEIIHGGHDIKHRSMDPATAGDSAGMYPYLVPQPLRRNLVIPLHRRRR